MSNGDDSKQHGICIIPVVSFCDASLSLYAVFLFSILEMGAGHLNRENQQIKPRKL